MSNTFRVRDPLAFKCRCGGDIEVGYLADALPNAKWGGRVLLHSMPYCPQFEGLEPPDFLAWSRTGELPKGTS